MKELSLKELQICSLQILKKVHSFCLKNDIKYSLAYGTLLGAVRHKGFIPWDDDIDIMMPRPEYERFCNTFQADGVTLYCYQNDPSCYLSYARVCDDVNTVSSRNSWRYGGGNTGVWIDIFPIDGVEDDPESYDIRFKRARDYYYRLFRYRAFLNGCSKENSFKLNCFALLLKLWPFSAIMKKQAHRFVKKAAAFQSEIPFKGTNHCSLIAFPGLGSAHYMNVADFEFFEMMPFEDSLLSVIKNYDNVLKNWYGDYMQLPPESERVPAHNVSGQKFYWKES